MNASLQVTENSRLTLTGSVTVRHAAQMASAALELLKQNRDATLVCTEAEYLDGSILQQILMLASALRSRGKQLRILGLPETLQRDCRLSAVSNFLANGNGA